MRSTIRYIMAISLASLLLALSSLGATDPGEDPNSRYQLGVRLGVWSNMGETPPTSAKDSAFISDINDANFYVEGYLAYRLLPPAYVELSIGSVNRGEIILDDGEDRRIGNLIVTPLLLQLKLYPIGAPISRFRPFVSAGGGLYFGRRTVQFTTVNDPYYHDLQGESRTAFGYTLSTGFDWALGKWIGLEMMARYLPIRFSNELALIEDYEALAVTIGIKYFRHDK